MRKSVWLTMASANAVYSFLNVLIEKTFWKICYCVFLSFRDIAAWFYPIISAAYLFVWIAWTCFDNLKVIQLGVF